MRRRAVPVAPLVEDWIADETRRFVIADDVVITNDSRVLFVGTSERIASRLRLVGGFGELIVEGTVDELDQAETALASLDGWTTYDRVLGGTSLPPHRLWEMTRGLVATGAAVDLSESWRDFYRLTCNPPTNGRLTRFERAYELERWSPETSSARELNAEHDGPLNRLARQRRSVPLGDLKPAAVLALDGALQLAADAYRNFGDRRPIAAGGALYPLHFWVAGLDGDQYVFFAIDHDRGTVAEWTRVPHGDMDALFAPDTEVQHALAVGAALIVVAADPRRTVLKYADRAMRYVLMEVGAVTHHMTLESVELGLKIRPIGGFLDRPLQALLASPPIPLLTLFVGL